VKQIFNLPRLSAGLAVLVLLSACQSEPDPAHVRAQAKWDHLIAEEYAEAWEYYTPGYRETSPVEQYRASLQQRPVRWEEAEVISSECEESRCEVEIDITYSIPRARAGLEQVRPTRPIRETWILSRGQWWFTPEN